MSSFVSSSPKKLKLQTHKSSDNGENMEVEDENISTKQVDLPCSILMDILARLPLKLLFDFRCVNKSWRSLLSETYFYKLYSQHQPSTLILGVEFTSPERLREFSLIEQKCGGDGGDWLALEMRPLTSNYRNPPPEFKVEYGNGCNGLICLSEIETGEPRMVWNPIKSQYVILPEPATKAVDKVVAGFGFCGRNNRYKVLRIFHMKGDSFSKQRVEIYDLGVVGENWREIEDYSPFLIPSRKQGFFINNSLHWILKNNYKENDNFVLICGFDFVEESFKAITPPPIFSSHQKNKYYWSNLGIIPSALSICAVNAKEFRPDVQVWVMEEYGVPESWALKFSIKDFNIEWWDPYRWIQVTNILSNEEIIVLCAQCCLRAYNIRERQFRSVKVFDFPAIAHVPSFVSLEDVLSGGSLNVRYM